jgi:hypothetical protein
VRVCGAKFGNLLLYEEGAFRVAAMRDAPSTGGGGVVGADYVLKSAADGHVMLFGDPNLNSLRPQPRAARVLCAAGFVAQARRQPLAALTLRSSPACEPLS